MAASSFAGITEHDRYFEGIEEKLSTEIYTYGKSDVRRMGKKGSKKKADDLDDIGEDVLKEIKELMKD